MVLIRWLRGLLGKLLTKCSTIKIPRCCFEPSIWWSWTIETFLHVKCYSIRTKVSIWKSRRIHDLSTLHPEVMCIVVICSNPGVRCAVRYTVQIFCHVLEFLNCVKFCKGIFCCGQSWKWHMFWKRTCDGFRILYYAGLVKASRGRPYQFSVHYLIKLFYCHMLSHWTFTTPWYHL